MGSEQSDFTDFLLIISGVLIILGGITGRSILFVISFLYLLYFSLNFWYEKSIATHFYLKIIKKIIAMFLVVKPNITLNFKILFFFRFFHGFFGFFLIVWWRFTNNFN